MNRIHYILTSLIVCLLLVGCQDVEEPLNTIPTVKTDAVTEVGMKEAFVSGSVSSKSSCTFLLSKQQDLSDAIAINARCTDETNGIYKGELGQLSPNTTYYVALCATDGYSQVIGNVQSFTTASCLGIANVTLADWDTGEQQPFQSTVSSILYSKTLGELLYDLQFTLAYGNGWSMSPAREIGFEKGDTLKFFAYYPTMDDIQDYTRMHIDANTDFVYGNSEELSSSKPNANIALKHLMAKVSFEVKISGDDDRSIKLQYANLRNAWTIQSNAIALDCYFNLLSGELSEGDAYYGHDGLLTQCDFELSTENSLTIDFYVIPTTFKEGEVVFQLYSDHWSEIISSTLGEASWLSGQHYIYPVVITSSGLQIGTVRVEEWENNEGGSIIVNK